MRLNMLIMPFFRWSAAIAACFLTVHTASAELRKSGTLFETVLSHLDIGGEQFNFFQSPPDVGNFGTLLDKVLQSMPHAEAGKIPPGLSISKLVDTLGLTCVKAYGSSGVTEESAVHRRAYFHIPGPKQGLMGVFGDESKPFFASSNPAGADLAVEFEIDLRRAVADLIEMARKMMPAEEVKKLEAELAKPVPNTPLPLGQILENAALRVSLTGYLRPDDKLPIPNSPVMAPGVDLILALDGLGWLLNPLSQTLLQSAAQPGGPTEVQESGNTVFVRFKEAMGPPPMDFQPTIEYNKETGRVVLTSRQALTDALKTGASKLGTSEVFKQATHRLPTDGNVLIYTSKRLSQTLQNLVEESIKATSAPQDVEGAVALQKLIFGQYFPPQPQALVLGVKPDGIFVGSNSAIPPADAQLGTISMLAVIAGMALPAMNEVSHNARATKEMNKARQVIITLKVYSADHDGKYPKDLKELLADNSPYLEDEKLLSCLNPTTHVAETWLYNAGHTDFDSGDIIILLSPTPDKKGNRIAGYNDGSVRQITEEEAASFLQKIKQ
jgi:hypothetical protein